MECFAFTDFPIIHSCQFQICQQSEKVTLVCFFYYFIKDVSCLELKSRYYHSLLKLKWKIEIETGWNLEYP